MRLPAKSEPEAFRIVLASSILVGVSLLVGYLVRPLAGVALLALVTVGAVARKLLAKEPEFALREAEQAGHRAGPPARRVLVVVAEALAGSLPEEVIASPGEPRPRLELLSPVLQSRTHFVTTDIDRERAEARQRLDMTLAWARKHGFEATGEVGDPIDPLAGIEDELRRYDVNEVIVATRSLDHANWLESGMLARLQEQLSVRVRHLATDAATEASPAVHGGPMQQTG